MDTLSEILQIQSPAEYNIRLEDYLRNTNLIPNELLLRFDEAYEYDAATSTNWLISKLTILHQRVMQYEQIYLDDRNSKLTTITFKEFVEQRYQRIAKSLFKS